MGKLEQNKKQKSVIKWRSAVVSPPESILVFRRASRRPLDHLLAVV